MKASFTIQVKGLEISREGRLSIESIEAHADQDTNEEEFRQIMATANQFLARLTSVKEGTLQ